MEDRTKIDREFWVAYEALSQTLGALNKAVRECNSLNSKDLNGWPGQYQAMYKELRKQRKGGLC